MEPTIYKPSIYNGAGIYKTGAEGGAEGGGDLPDEYEERMYIYNTSNGSAMIDLSSLGRKFVFSDKFEFLFSPGDLKIDADIDVGFQVLARNQNIAWRYFVTRCFKSQWCSISAASRYDTSIPEIHYTNTGLKNYGMPEIFKIENDGQVLKMIINGQVFDLYSYSTYGGADPAYSLYFFYNDGHENCPNTKIFSMKIFEGTTDKLKLWVKPCVRKLDGAPGLFDIVTETFFTAATPSNLGASPA